MSLNVYRIILTRLIFSFFLFLAKGLITLPEHKAISFTQASFGYFSLPDEFS